MEEQEQWYPDEKHGGLIFFIILFVFTIVGILGYIAYQKGILTKLFVHSEKETSEKELEETEEQISLSDSRFKDTYDFVSDSIYQSDRKNGYESFSPTELVLMATSLVDKSDFKKLEESSSSEDSYYGIKGSTLIAYLKPYFGRDLTIDFDEIETNMGSMVPFSMESGSFMQVVSYDSSTDMLKVQFLEEEEADEMGSMSQIVSASLKENLIQVTEKVVYVEYDQIQEEEEAKNVYYVYSDRNHEKLIDQVEISDEEDGLNISVSDYLEEAGMIRSIYQYDEFTNTYVFVSASYIEGSVDK